MHTKKRQTQSLKVHLSITDYPLGDKKSHIGHPHPTRLLESSNLLDIEGFIILSLQYPQMQMCYKTTHIRRMIAPSPSPLHHHQDVFFITPERVRNIRKVLLLIQIYSQTVQTSHRCRNRDGMGGGVWGLDPTPPLFACLNRHNLGIQYRCRELFLGLAPPPLIFLRR